MSSVVGQYLAAGKGHGALWQDGQLTDFGEVSGVDSALPFRVNDAGAIAGTYDIGMSGIPKHPFLFSNGTFTDLGTLPNPQLVLADVHAINSSRMVVGRFRDTENTNRRAFVWTEGNGMQDILGVYGEAHDVNDIGQVVGRSARAGGQYGYRWQNGSVEWLEFANALGTNEVGDVVGSKEIAGNLTGYLLSGGEYHDFNDITSGLGDMHVFAAFDITQQGVVLARARVGDPTTWLVLQPIPEPETFTIMAAITGAFLLRRKLVTRVS
jgi:probable HAF family extracellular repeat protein